METIFDEARRHFAAGAWDACAAACDRALAGDPGNPQLLHLLGAARLRAGAPGEAQGWLQQALRAAPADLPLRFDCANCALATGDQAMAVRLLAEGAQFHPGNRDLAARLGGLLADLGMIAEALEVLQSGLTANPGDLELQLQLGGELAAAFRFDDAMALLQAAGQSGPGGARLASNTGMIHQTMGRLAEAIRCYRQAIALAPGDAQAHMNLATALMTASHFTEGWAEYEWRLRLPGNRPLPAAPPRWQGEPLAGRRLRLTVEQGYGDIIQHVRFIPALARLGGEILLEAPAPLARLFAGLAGVSAIVAPDADAGADFQLPLLSLPHLLSRFDLLAGIPEPPFLAKPAGPAKSGSGLQVGLIWRVKPASGDRLTRRLLDGRSCPAALLRPLLTIPGVTWHSLQLAEGSQQTETADPAMISHHLADFADTAQVMAGLDLVIAVDTAAAHLAGAMGVPLWVLLGPHQHEYRWGTDRSPWYPDATLFRTGPSGWPGLIQQVGAALGVLAQAGS